MASPTQILDAGKAIADALSEVPGLHIRPYPVLADQLSTGDGTLTVAASSASMTNSRRGYQQVEWDLQILLDSAASSDGTKVERQVANYLSEDTDDSLFGKLRPFRKLEAANRHGSPQLIQMERDIFNSGGTILTLLSGKVVANL